MEGLYMKKILVLVLLGLSALAFADKPAPHFIHNKKKPKVVITLPPPPPLVIMPMPIPPDKVLPPSLIVITPTVLLPPVVKLPIKVCKFCPSEGSVVTNLHLSIGIGVQQPWASGIAGVRLEFPKIFLGVEPFISIPYGIGMDGLIYAYRGKFVQFYPLSIGFMLNWNYGNSTTFPSYLSDPDIARLIDLRLGMGLQIKLACHVKLAIDLRTSIPDPVKLSRDDGVCQFCSNSTAHALDTKTAVANAFAQTQFIVGLLFW